MKKISLILVILYALISCEKTDYRIEMSGTVWTGSKDTSSEKTITENGNTVIVTTEYHHDVTLKFLYPNEGVITIESVKTVDGLQEPMYQNEFDFYYSYDYDLMWGTIFYIVPGYWGYGEYMESNFIIKANRIHESNGIVDNIEYRKM